MAIGLVFATNGYRWPSSDEYLSSVLPKIRHIVTSRDLQARALVSVWLKPWRLLTGRGPALAEALQSCWGITKGLQDLPERPCWYINATTFHSGKNWRFSRARMGDWRFGYLDSPDVPLATALAASAGVPYVIGRTTVRLPRKGWYEQEPRQTERRALPRPRASRVSLWDGGVYENLGVEALYKIGTGFVESSARFLLVCDAAQRLVEEPLKVHGPIYFQGILPRISINVRTIDIMTDQNRALRSRFLVTEMAAGRLSGCYIRIGNSGSFIARASSSQLGKEVRYANTLSDTAVRALSEYPTVLSKVAPPLFDDMVAHGYETTDATVSCYRPGCLAEVVQVDKLRGGALPNRCTRDERT